MKELFKEIKRIDKIAYRPLSKATCKLSEEYGELVQAINKGMGMKKHNLSREEVRNNIKEESADLIQNIFLLASRFKIDYDELVSALSYKNKVWKNKYGKKKKHTK